MTVKTDSSLSPAITQANFMAAIVAAMTDAGFPSIFDSFSSGGTEFRIWELNFNASTFGKAYLQVSLTAGLAVQSRLFTAFNAATDTGTNGGTQATAVTFTTGTSISFSAFKPTTGSEFRQVLIQQGSTVAAIAYVRPANIPSWWDENSHLYCFLPTTPSWATMATAATAASPYGSATLSTSVGDSSLTNAAPNGKRDVLAGFFINSGTSSPNANSGKAGKTSDEIGIGACSGLTILSIIQVIAGVEEYYVLSPGAGQLVFLI